MGVLLDRFILTQIADLSDKPAPHAIASASAENSAPTQSTTASHSKSAAPSEPAPSSAAADSTSRKSLDEIIASGDPRQRTRDLQAYISSLKPNQFADALKRVRQITSSNERELASRLLVAHWVQTDPDGALQFAAGARGYEYLADDVFQQHAATNFQAAVDKAKEIPGGALRYHALRGALRFKADTDPAGAVELAGTLGEFRGSEPLRNVIYRQWATNDPPAAAAHAAQQGGGGWRSPVMQVVDTWADQDPVAAANWSLSLPDERARGQAIMQAVRDWGRDQPTAAANWIHSLPTGQARDTAVASLAFSMVNADPQTALGWVASMSDEQARQRTLQRMSREVMRADPQNGSAMLQAAGLPADQIDQRGRGRWPERRGRP